MTQQSIYLVFRKWISIIQELIYKSSTVKIEYDSFQRSASRKAGGCGICYFVRVKGQDARLFYEDSPDACRWFVESKYPV